MKIAIFSQKDSFKKELQDRLAVLGEVSYIAERKEYSEEELLKFAADAEIIGGGS